MYGYPDKGDNDDEIIIIIIIIIMTITTGTIAVFNFIIHCISKWKVANCALLN